MNEAHVHSLARNNTSFISEHDSIALLNSESSPDTSLAISTSPSSAPLTTQSPDSSQSTDYAQALRDPVPSLDAGNVPKIGNTSSRRRRNSRTVHYLSKPQLYLCILWTVISTHPPPQKRHLRPHKCELANCKYHTKGFALRKDLDRHRFACHNSHLSAPARRHLCPHHDSRYAVEGFTRKDNFNRHIRNAHS
ncbi:hypothetical protein BDZ45DRAFT_266611 [Acephala macrosclerotiorum]|nr:hypothetical protein BDZ45DRAFT_266611 [Acephala macrosclerotiorum]